MTVHANPRPARLILVATCAVAALLAIAAWGARAEAAIPFSWKKSADLYFAGDSCGDSHTRQIAVPEGAYNIKLISGPEVGEKIDDDYGDPIATVSSVEVRPGDDGRRRLYVTVAPDSASCLPAEDDYEDSGWETEEVRFVVGYSRRERIWFNEFYAEGDEQWTRQRPKWIKCGTDCGWQSLKWKRWGGRVAQATGKFRYINKTVAAYTTLDYPVTVTLSKPRACYGRVRYTYMRTRFLSGRPFWIKQQVKNHRIGCSRGIF